MITTANLTKLHNIGIAGYYTYENPTLFGWDFLLIIEDRS